MGTSNIEKGNTPPKGGFMGLSPDVVLDALHEAAWDAQRHHEKRGVPMVIWRDGKVAEILPAEFKEILEAAQRSRAAARVRSGVSE